MFHENPGIMGRTDSIIRRTDAVSMDTLVREYIRDMKIAAGLDSQLAREAWDRASGAGRYTLGCSLRGGRLYVTLSSSVQRSRLSLQKQGIMDEINRILGGNALFSGNAERDIPVRDIIMK